MNARILIVEDEQDIAEVMVMYLNRENVDPHWVQSGEDALKIFAEKDFDMVLLDINLPGMDGYEILREIRKISEIPVIIVSAREEDVDMILGFGVGADDYVVKPFSPGVLTARIRAHLRRMENQSEKKTDLFLFDPWTLDRTHRILNREGEALSLSPREMDLLIFLTENCGRAFTQSELYEKVWGNSFGDLSTVSVHIQRLRKKLEDNPSNPRYIKNRYGYGYYFQEPGR